jgi:hypothetical protein
MNKKERIIMFKNLFRKKSNNEPEPKKEYIDVDVWYLRIIFKQGNDILLAKVNDCIPDAFNDCLYWYIEEQTPAYELMYGKNGSNIDVFNRDNVEFINVYCKNEKRVKIEGAE